MNEALTPRPNTTNILELHYHHSIINLTAKKIVYLSELLYQASYPSFTVSYS